MKLQQVLTRPRSPRQQFSLCPLSVSSTAPSRCTPAASSLHAVCSQTWPATWWRATGHPCWWCRFRATSCLRTCGGRVARPCSVAAPRRCCVGLKNNERSYISSYHRYKLSQKKYERKGMMLVRHTVPVYAPGTPSCGLICSGLNRCSLACDVSRMYSMRSWAICKSRVTQACDRCAWLKWLVWKQNAKLDWLLVKNKQPMMMVWQHCVWPTCSSDISHEHFSRDKPTAFTCAELLAWLCSK